MPGGFAPRFAIEAGFLILLGVGSGYANLRTAVIVAVLLGGWLLVSLIEVAVWRTRVRPVGPFTMRQPEPDEDQEDAVGGGPGPGSDSVPEPVEPDIAYPLRADAGTQPSEEIEAYTRVLAGQPEGGPPDEHADG
jgi:hypothetical protein